MRGRYRTWASLSEGPAGTHASWKPRGQPVSFSVLPGSVRGGTEVGERNAIA